MLPHGMINCCFEMLTRVNGWIYACFETGVSVTAQ